MDMNTDTLAEKRESCSAEYAEQEEPKASVWKLVGIGFLLVLRNVLQYAAACMTVVAAIIFWKVSVILIAILALVGLFLLMRCMGEDYLYNKRRLALRK